MPVAEQKPEYLTLEEASERFNLAVRTLRAWRAKRWLTIYERRDGRAIVDAHEIQRELSKRFEVIKRSDQDDE